MTRYVYCSIQMSQVYKEGKTAARNGFPKSSCDPHTERRTDMYHKWLAGWHDYHIMHNTGVYE